MAYNGHAPAPDTAAAADFERVTLYHAAGSSSMNAVLLVEEDTTKTGLFDTRTYLLQNWRHDVVAITKTDGDVKAMAGYTAYGTPLHAMRADLDKDGNVDFGDFSIYTGQFGIADCSGSGPVGCTADFDRDGDVDGKDTNIFNADNGDAYTDRLGVLASAALGRGYAGSQHDEALTGSMNHKRYRAYRSDMGRFAQRDPLEFVDGPSMYGYVRAMPVGMVDPMGLAGCKVTWSCSSVGMYKYSDPSLSQTPFCKYECSVSKMEPNTSLLTKVPNDCEEYFGDCNALQGIDMTRTFYRRAKKSGFLIFSSYSCEASFSDTTIIMGRNCGDIETNNLPQCIANCDSIYYDALSLCDQIGGLPVKNELSPYYMSCIGLARAARAACYAGCELTQSGGTITEDGKEIPDFFPEGLEPIDSDGEGSSGRPKEEQVTCPSGTHFPGRGGCAH